MHLLRELYPMTSCWVTVHNTLSPEPSAQRSYFSLNKRREKEVSGGDNMGLGLL